MRIHSAAAAALVLALCACAAQAQPVAFPAPTFRGGNVDWQVVLTTQSDLSVVYQIKVPQADKPQKGGLAQRNAARGEYLLVGTIGAEKTAMTVKIVPLPLGKPCKLNDGRTGDSYGRFTYLINVIPQPSKPVSTGSDHKPWPATWSGCGNFTLN